MLTVKEMFSLLLNAKEVVVTMNGRNYTLLDEKAKVPDEILMKHFQDFVVECVQACEEDCFAFDILMAPVKKEA